MKKYFNHRFHAPREIVIFLWLGFSQKICMVRVRTGPKKIFRVKTLTIKTLKRFLGAREYPNHTNFENFIGHREYPNHKKF